MSFNALGCLTASAYEGVSLNRTFEEVGLVVDTVGALVGERVGALVGDTVGTVGRGLGHEIFVILEPAIEELAAVPVEAVGSPDGMLDGIPVGDPRILGVPAAGPAAVGPEIGVAAGD